MPATLALAIVGFVEVYRRRRTMFYFLVVVMAADIAYCAVYNISEDKDAYYLPTFISVTIAAAFGARWLRAVT